MNTAAAEPRHVFRIGAKRLCVGTSMCRISQHHYLSTATGLLPGAMNTAAAEPRHVFRIGAKRLCVGTSVCRISQHHYLSTATGLLPGAMNTAVAEPRHVFRKQRITRIRVPGSRAEKPHIVAAGAILVNSGACPPITGEATTR